MRRVENVYSLYDRVKWEVFSLVLKMYYVISKQLNSFKMYVNDLVLVRVERGVRVSRLSR